MIERIIYQFENLTPIAVHTRTNLQYSMQMFPCFQEDETKVLNIPKSQDFSPYNT